MVEKNRPLKNQNLECVRGIAALAVFTTHFISIIPELATRKNHVVNLAANWGTEAVIIFFILSGIVIHSSVNKKHRTKFEFLYQRIVRLHPTLIITMLFCVYIEYNVFHQHPPIGMIVSNMIPISTLSGYLAPVFWKTNPVIWSLTYEIFFYVFFSLVVIKGKEMSNIRMFIYFMLSLICIYLYYMQFRLNFVNHFIQMLAFSSIWILGFYASAFNKNLPSNLILAIFGLLSLPLLSRLKLTTNFYDPIKYLLFAINALPIFVFFQRPTTGNIEFKKTDYMVLVIIVAIHLFAVIAMLQDESYRSRAKLAYSIAPVITLLFFLKSMRHVARLIYTKIIRPFFSYFGNLSYPIYLLHFPIITFIYYKFNFSLMFKIPLILLVTFVVSYLTAQYLQPSINKILLKRNK
ncbi:peptidoglycan/LPS O-acetylase OafA/YrhL [Flavobacterium sp. W4I14]|nr:peptidoglycan/LPS O-acetylase OafA/YrhL [Flavobacterium sp. W4I14]